MPLFRFDRVMVLFAHVPKTGGTSLEEAMMAMGGRSALLLTKAARDYSACTPQHMPADILDRVVPSDFYDMGFAVVRDPLERMISEFRMRRAARAARGQAPLDFAGWVDLAFRRHAKNPYAFDNHIRPQTELVPEGMTVFRYEDGLDVPLAAVAARAGCAPAALPHLRRGGGGPVTVQPETASQLAEFYRADYDRFGYAPPRAHP